MRTTLMVVLTAGLLAYALAPQWRSIDRMGERRIAFLNRLPEELLVGVCWPFSFNQDGMADGLRLALDEINAGMLAGLPVRLVLRDDEFDWNKGKEIALEFSATPRMSAVLGYYDDAAAIKASTIYEPAKMLNLIVGANATSMTARRFQYVVRTTLSSEKISRSLARMLVARGHKKYALIWEEDAYGEDLAYQFNVSLNSFDTRVVYEWSYSRQRHDFRLPVNELKGVDADLVLFAGLEPWAGDFLREARRVGLKTDIVGAFSNTPQMRERAGQAIEGSMYFEIYDPASATPENQAFVRKYRDRFHKDPDAWAAQGYDALHLLARAARSSRSANPLDLTYALRFMSPWQGANGRYHFNSQGDLDEKPIYLNLFRNGAPLTIAGSSAEPAPATR
jgi:branched-chain amino acid transport system substrate-binding protein